MIFFVWPLALPWLSLLLLPSSFILFIPCCPAGLVSHVRVFSGALCAASRSRLPSLESPPLRASRSPRKAQRCPVPGVVEPPGPVLFVNVTLSLLPPVLLVPLDQGHPRLSIACVSSGTVTGCKDQFRLSLKEHRSLQTVVILTVGIVTVVIVTVVIVTVVSDSSK